MIQELERRGLGDPALLSSLRYVVNYGRDLETHGEKTSIPSLKIMCDTVFEVVPQVAALVGS